MKTLLLENLEIEVLNSTLKKITDKETGKETIYYEVTYLSKLFEGTDKFTTSENVKLGKQKRDFTVMAKNRNEDLKLKLNKQDIPMPPNTGKATA